MDWSPILISMKTASVSIVLTFFLGILAAWWVVSMKNERMKIHPGWRADAAAGAAAYGGGLFPLISVWGETAHRHLLFAVFRCEDSLLLGGHGAGSGGDVLPAHVPFCKGSV